MASDDPVHDDRIESVTARHMRDLRRTQDMFLDLLKRQMEMTGRVARDFAEFKIETSKNFNELHSDLLLLENRSITAAENDEFFRRELGAIREELAAIRDDAGSIKAILARMEAALVDNSAPGAPISRPT